MPAGPVLATPEAIAERIIALLEQGGLVYNGRRVDRAWVIATLEHASQMQQARLDELLREAFDVDPDRSEEQRERLVEVNGPVRVALLRLLAH